MIEVNQSELPPALIASISGDEILCAFSLPETGRHVVRTVAPSGRTEELEYDPAAGRSLTLEERQRELPPPVREVLSSEQLTVTRTPFIDPGTGERRTRIEVADATGAIVHRVDQTVFDPDAALTEAVLQQVIRQLGFGAKYATWSRAERVAHWAAMLHRLRRSRGEDGRDEDDLYSQALVQDMEKVDPHVRALLRDILVELGRLEQTSADDAIAAFTAGTGIRVS